MHSALYIGRLRHRRLAPRRHEFAYRVFMLGDPDLALDQAVRDCVTAQTGARPEGPIRMLTHLRYFGLAFNPVTFYYCFDRAGRTVELEKRFVAYDWRFRPPGRRLAVHMQNFESGAKTFDATLDLDRREITAATLAQSLIAFPFMSARVLVGIYWQALRLWLKRTRSIPTLRGFSKMPPATSIPVEEQAARRSGATAQPSPPMRNSIDRIARHLVFGKLSQLRAGCIAVIDGDERQVFGTTSDAFAQEVQVQVHDPRFYGDLALGGSIGAGEAYMNGYWSTAHLVDLVRLLVLNMDVLDGLEEGSARLLAPLRKVLHAFRRNTRSGARKNIAAHYDLGNEFFELFLDETMMYSAATFAAPDMSLHEAQLTRLDLIARKLRLQASDRLVEIGTGWGGFALHAAQRYGCRVTTTTISQEQCRLARERVAAAGLSDRVEVLCEDYRDLAGRYDKLVSIEMIEAVGHHYYDTFFRKCSGLLESNGAMLLQAITIADQRYERARRSVDFIQRYIFPGSCLPSVSVLASSIARSSDLSIFDLDDIGMHYARTLREWRRNMFSNLWRVREFGYSCS